MEYNHIILLGGDRMPSGRNVEEPKSICRLFMVTALVACLTIAGSLPGAPQDKPPQVRVDARLVRVSVVVHDEKGAPVSGLTKDDFTIEDKGKTEAIAFFSREQAVRTAARQPEGVFTNRVNATSTEAPPITIIMLDTLNTHIQDVASARQHLIKFLAQVQKDDLVALYVLHQRLQVLHTFTSDSASLVRAIRDYQAQYSRGLSDSEPTPSNTGFERPEGPLGVIGKSLDEFLNAAQQSMADYAMRDRVRRTVSAFQQMGANLGRMPGRKNLIWVSGAFPASVGHDQGQMQLDQVREAAVFYEEMEQAAQALNDAGIALYPVDARGLLNPGQMAAFSAEGRGIGPRNQGNTASVPTFSALSSTKNVDTMVTLADRTGGRAFHNTNDMFGSIRAAIEDSSSTYTLGFYPTHGRWDGKFREIKVQIRGPGLKARYRRGYFALAEKPLDDKSRQGIMREAATSILDATGLGLAAAMLPADPPSPKRARVQFVVARDDVRFTPQGDRSAGQLDFLFVLQKEDGTALTAVKDGVQMRLTQATFQAAASGLVLAKDLDIPDGAAQIRLVVLDPATGATGSVSIPVRRP